MISSCINGRRLAVVFAAGMVWVPSAAHACATCFGDPESPQAQGLNGAIITLLSITYGLFALAAFGVYMLIRRSRSLRGNSEDQPVRDGELTHG